MSARVCPCGCRGYVKPKRTYATRRCFLRTLTPAQRRANHRAWLARTPNAREILAENGSKGGRAIHAERWINLLEQWQDKTPREALQAAFRSGYAYGWRARRRAERERLEVAS